MKLLFFPSYEAFLTCIAPTQSPKGGSSTFWAQAHPDSAVTLMPVMQHNHHWIVELGRSAFTASFASATLVCLVTLVTTDPVVELNKR